MKTSLGACAALAVALVVSGCNQKPVEPKPLPTPPSIIEFSADQTRVGPGDAVTLSFKTANASQAEVVDQNGNKVELTGDASEGLGVVHPMATSFYVLRVTGEGGKASAFVQVAVDEDLKSVFLVAVPPQIDSGASAQLIWSAFRAKTAVIHTSTGEDLAVDPAVGSGVIDVTPARTVSYQLVASGVDEQNTLDQTAEVSVRPVVAEFTANPPAARQDETITLSWTTRGAAEVTLSEATFGALKTVSVPADETQVDQGSFQWTVPATLPSGDAMMDGFPLEFTLTVKQSNPEVTLTRQISSFVGEGPKVVSFEVPPAVTNGLDYSIAWKTLNATRVQIFADGGLIYEPLVRDQNKVASGSISLKAPQQDTTFKIIAWGSEHTQVEETRVLRVVAPPEVTEFTLPQTITAAGDSANAAWKTTHATRVLLRVKDGPAVYSTADAARVASGNADVYPGLRTTFVLEAYNDAGQMASMEKSVNVAAPGSFSVSPNPTTSGETLTLDWSFDPATTAGVFGDPTVQPLKNNPNNDWYELDGHVDAQALSFDNLDNSVAEIPVPAGFSFPFFGQTPSTFYASTNGFIAFNKVGALPSNVKLDDFSKSAPAMVAPFWDDLVFDENSRVLYLVEGTSFPRRLIVQWDKVHTAADFSSTLTFQVQLFETGEVRFGYENLTGADSAGEHASIGFRANDSIARDVAIDGAASLAQDDEWIFFNNGQISGTYSVTGEDAATYVMFTRTASGKYVVFPAHASVFHPDDVVINELMLLPDLSATAGQWVELYNTTDRDLDLAGTRLSSAATMTEFELPPETWIPAHGYLVLGQSTDPLANGGAQVDLAWSGLTLDPAQDDDLTLSAGNPITTFSYATTDLIQSTSLQGPDRSEDLLLDEDTPLLCAPTSMFGTNGAVGTPGSANDSCFPYTLTSIPVNFEDITATGTVLLGSGVDDDTQTVDLSSAPFPYFGTPQSSLEVSSNGVIGLPSLDSSYSGNHTSPSTGYPDTSLAVFWDDLETVEQSTAEGVYAQYLPASGPLGARWIIQWKNISHYNNSDDLNFEAKLFDDGTIEYHYATMVSGSSANYADGTSATVWLQSPDGIAALPVSIETARTWQDTAVRYSPKP